MAIHTEYSVRTNSPYPTSTRSSTRLPASERKASRRRPPESLSTRTPQASSCEPSPRRAEPSPAAPSQLQEYALIAPPRPGRGNPVRESAHHPVRDRRHHLPGHHGDEDLGHPGCAAAPPGHARMKGHASAPPRTTTATGPKIKRRSVPDMPAT